MISTPEQCDVLTPLQNHLYGDKSDVTDFIYQSVVVLLTQSCQRAGSFWPQLPSFHNALHQYSHWGHNSIWKRPAEWLGRYLSMNELLSWPHTDNVQLKIILQPWCWLHIRTKTGAFNKATSPFPISYRCIFHWLYPSNNEPSHIDAIAKAMRFETSTCVPQVLIQPKAYHLSENLTLFCASVNDQLISSCLSWPNKLTQLELTKQ
jgi:hypothetical protein